MGQVIREESRRMISATCSTVKNCGNIRTCQKCASRRQRDIANAAEALERQHGQLTFTRLTPESNTQDEIRRLRASFIRRALAPAGIWTIETGETFGALHINILSPKPAPARWRGCSSYSELVRCTSREAAAYIAKQSGMPPIEQYSGNLYGAFGQLFSYLTSENAHATVQAAALEVSMRSPTRSQTLKESKTMRTTPSTDPENWILREDLYDPAQPTFYRPDAPEKSNPPYHRKEKSKEERIEIMRRHLPNIYAIIGKPEPAHPVLIGANNDTNEWAEGRE
jgi:hypothetical protein